MTNRARSARNVANGEGGDNGTQDRRNSAGSEVSTWTPRFIERMPFETACHSGCKLSVGECQFLGWVMFLGLSCDADIRGQEGAYRERTSGAY
jgi:hypothetical protein